MGFVPLYVSCAVSLISSKSWFPIMFSHLDASRSPLATALLSVHLIQVLASFMALHSSSMQMIQPRGVGFDIESMSLFVLHISVYMVVWYVGLFVDR